MDPVLVELCQKHKIYKKILLNKSPELKKSISIFDELINIINDKLKFIIIWKKSKLNYRMMIFTVS